MEPQVSVVVPVYNMARFLPEAVASVQAQTYQNWELILVDDGSQDESPEIARQLAQQDSRITCLEHPDRANQGCSLTRNLGISRARGAFVAFLDADDRWSPCKLQEQLQLMNQFPSVDVVRGRVRYWCSWNGGEDSLPGLDQPLDQPLQPPSGLWICSPLGRGRAPNPSDILVRKGALQAVGGLEPQFTGLYEDHALMAKLYLRSAVLACDACWTYYRQHPESLCARQKEGVHRARGQYLQWLSNYLKVQGIGHRRIKWALWKARLLWNLSQLVRSATGKDVLD